MRRTGSSIGCWLIVPEAIACLVPATIRAPTRAVGEEGGRIGRWGAGVWEGFGGGGYFAALFASLQVGLRHFGEQRGGSDIGAPVELRVVDIGDMYHRGEVEIEPVRCEVLRVLDALRLCLAGIVGRADIGGGRSWSIQALQAVYRSALLVDGYRQGNGAIALHLLDKPFELLLINDIIVRCEEQDGPYVVLADQCAVIYRIRWAKKLDNRHLA